MPEETNPQQGQQGNGNGDAGANGAAQQAGGTGQSDSGQQGQLADPVAYARAMEKRWEEEKAERQKLSLQLKDIETQRQQQLQQNGQFEDLYKSAQTKIGEYEPKAKAYDELVEEIRSDNKRRVDALPEDVRDIVPQLGAVELRRWLDKAEVRLMRPAAPGTDAGAGLGGGGGSKITVTDADRQAAEAAKERGYKITAEDIAKRRQQK